MHGEQLLADSPGYEVSGAVMNNSNDRVCVLGHSSGKRSQ